MGPRSRIARSLLGLLLVASFFGTIGCTTDPLLNNVHLPLGYFPCSSFGPDRISWETHPFSPVPDTLPTPIDAGPIPDAGTINCNDAGGPFFTPDAGPTTCEWVLFDENTTINIEHPLGRRPHSVEIYLSFNRDGSASTLGNGDSAVVMQACETDVTIRNNTNQRFFARVVLR